MELLRSTGVGRDVNRHHYTPDEIDAALARPVVGLQLDALRLRATHPAFTGTFSHDLRGARGELRWDAAGASVTLGFDLDDASFQLTATDGSATSTWSHARLTGD